MAIIFIYLAMYALYAGITGFLTLVFVPESEKEQLLPAMLHFIVKPGGGFVLLVFLVGAYLYHKSPSLLAHGLMGASLPVFALFLTIFAFYMLNRA